MFGSQYVSMRSVPGVDVAELSLPVSHSYIYSALCVFYNVRQVILIAGAVHTHETQNASREVWSVGFDNSLFSQHLAVGILVHYANIRGIGQRLIAKTLAMLAVHDDIHSAGADHARNSKLYARVDYQLRTLYIGLIVDRQW